MNSRNSTWKTRVATCITLLLLAAVWTSACCADNPAENKVIVFHASSLAKPFAEMKKQFEAQHPGVEVVLESAASQTTIRKVTELNREADVIASADYALIPQLMMPKYADWAAAFTRDHVVIAYTAHSKYRDQINAKNWYKILMRKDVNFGYSNPNLAPIGYRTIIIWRLADLYYKDSEVGGQKLSDALIAKCPQEYIRPNCNELLPLLETMTIDYIFEYESVAKQHNLQILRLPEKIDLSNEKYTAFYATASAETTGKAPGEKITQKGTPTIYGITIVKGAPHPKMAIEFVRFVLSPEGRKITAAAGQVPISPALVPNTSKVPKELSKLVKRGKGL